MGWLWTSSPPPKPSGTPEADKPSSTSPSPTPAPLNRAAPNEPVDPEIQKVLDIFQSDSSSSPQSSQQQQRTAASAAEPQSQSKIASWFKSSRRGEDGPETPNAPPHDAVSESLLPTEMSCRQAFDLAWSCNSLGGQWNAVYRHGEMRSCSEHWDDFWFCMRVKSQTGQAKAETVRQHYRNKEFAKYYAPGQHSSEEIWESRTERLPSGSAFAQEVEAPKVNDEEWRRQESDRRTQIRNELGYNNNNSAAEK